MTDPTPIFNGQIIAILVALGAAAYIGLDMYRHRKKKDDDKDDKGDD